MADLKQLQQAVRSFAERFIRNYPQHIKELPVEMREIHTRTGLDYHRHQHVARSSDVAVPLNHSTKVEDLGKASEVFALPAVTDPEFSQILQEGQKGGFYRHYGEPVDNRWIAKHVPGRASKKSIANALVEPYADPPIAPPKADVTVKFRRVSGSERASSGVGSLAVTFDEPGYLPQQAPSTASASVLATMEQAKANLPIAQRELDSYAHLQEADRQLDLATAMYAMAFFSPRTSLSENKDAVAILADLAHRHGGYDGYLDYLSQPQVAGEIARGKRWKTDEEMRGRAMDAVKRAAKSNPQLSAAIKGMGEEQVFKALGVQFGWGQIDPDLRENLGLRPQQVLGLDGSRFALTPLVVNPYTRERRIAEAAGDKSRLSKIKDEYGSQATLHFLKFFDYASRNPERMAPDHLMAAISEMDNAPDHLPGLAAHRVGVLEDYQIPGLKSKTFDFMRMGTRWDQEGAIGDIHASAMFDQALGGPGYSLQLGDNTYDPVTTWLATAIRRNLGKSDFARFSSTWSAMQSDNYLEHGSFFSAADRLGGLSEPGYLFDNGVWKRRR